MIQYPALKPGMPQWKERLSRAFEFSVMTSRVEPTPPLPQRDTPPGFHLLAKPSGSTCNIDYAYCFFLSKEALWCHDGSRAIQT